VPDKSVTGAHFWEGSRKSTKGDHRSGSKEAGEDNVEQLEAKCRSPQLKHSRNRAPSSNRQRGRSGLQGGRGTTQEPKGQGRHQWTIVRKSFCWQRRRPRREDLLGFVRRWGTSRTFAAKEGGWKKEKRNQVNGTGTVASGPSVVACY